MSRKVILLENEWSKENQRYELTTGEEAIFHQFGVNFIEFEHGIGNCSTGIIEHKDGKVEGRLLHMFRFVNEVQP